MIYDVEKASEPFGHGTRVTFTLTNHPDTPSTEYHTETETSGADIQRKMAAWASQFGRVRML